MSLVENIVALLLLLITIIPGAQALSSILVKYRQYQERVELLNLTENLCVFLQTKRVEEREIDLRYDGDRRVYTYGEEIFPVNFLEREGIKFYLEIGKVKDEELKWGELSSEDGEIRMMFVRGG